MSTVEAKSPAIKGAEENQQPVLNESNSLGQCWAAVRKDKVVLTISMKVPKDVDFEVFRVKAIETLSLLGDVKAGELFVYEGQEYFMSRPHKHQNRSKKKPKAELKPLKVFK